MEKKTACFVLSLILFLVACKEKKNNDVYPALEVIKSQVAKIDTSMYVIMKIVPVTDSTYDTSFVKREDFRTLAKEFLEVPDISKDFDGKYQETRLLSDEIGQAVFTATPSGEDLELRRQEVRISPGVPENKISSIYLETFRATRDSSVMKRMTWYLDWKFQVVTIVEKSGVEDMVRVMEVIWNQPDNF